MPLDRSLWETHLTRFHAPRWLCPRCSKGHLVLYPESVFFRPSGEAYARLVEDPSDRGNDLELRFSATLQCDNPACQETAAVAGIGQEKETYEQGHRELYVVLFPRFISPSPHLFSIPNATPASIADLIKSAFVLSWGDYEACINRVRVCLEMILDGLRIPRFAMKAGRRNPLTLHRRIELAQAKAPTTKPFLMAAKHLGNAGSHSGSLMRRDAFDALDLLEAVVTALYGEQKNVSRLALKIVKNRGPLKRKSGHHSTER
jgi:hypothetical protein